jgi:pilus assembly protein Flp/PilA
MMRIFTRFQVWRASDEGATAVEYGLMVGLIALAIIGGVTSFGLGVKGLFDNAVAKWPR